MTIHRPVPQRGFRRNPFPLSPLLLGAGALIALMALGAMSDQSAATEEEANFTSRASTLLQDPDAVIESMLENH